jgi:hypothetical protein
MEAFRRSNLSSNDILPNLRRAFQPFVYLLQNLCIVHPRGPLTTVRMWNNAIRKVV